jgi:hypothetical protein
MIPLRPMPGRAGKLIADNLIMRGYNGTSFF